MSSLLAALRHRT